MNDSPYNKLPDNIKRKFKIVYSELLDENITIFKNESEKWGVLKKSEKFGFFHTYGYIVKPIYNSIGFNRNLGLIEVVKYKNDKWNQDTNIHRFFDFEGKLIWESPKGVSITIDKLGNIITCLKNKYGLLNHKFETIINPIYDNLLAIDKSYLIAKQNGNYGITDINNRIVLELDYSGIINAILKNSLIVKDKNNKYHSFNLEDKLLVPLPFDKILLGTSNSKGKFTESQQRFFKSIINYSQNEDDFRGLEMLEHKGKWGIIEANGDVKIPNEYDYIDCLRNPNFFKVCKGNLSFSDEEDEQGNYRVYAENAKWGIIDSNNNLVVPIEYDWIEDIESTIWAVYKGGKVFYNDDYQEDYWTIKGGKLGIYNSNKLITPIEYDAVFTNWYRVKDYIFVQKGNQYFDVNSETYDVFTFDGKKIETNKPNPKNHYNNG